MPIPATREETAALADAGAITAVVCTRNRPDVAPTAVRSILANGYPNFSVIVIDQSPGEETFRRLAPHASDGRLSVIRTASRGVSISRNMAMRLARTELVCFTDDDCTVPVDWIFRMSRAFRRHRKIGLVYGNVNPAPHDPRLGVLPSYLRSEPVLITDPWRSHLGAGIGACMGVRNSAWRELGGFDEALGTGAPLQSGEETDFTMRCLLKGWYVFETNDVQVLHHGFRAWDEAQRLVRGYMVGTGAALAKLLRRRPAPLISTLLRLAWTWAFRRPLVDYGARPREVLRLKHFLTGLRIGFRLPIDPRHDTFKSEELKPKP